MISSQKLRPLNHEAGPRAVSLRSVVDKVTLAQEYFGFPLLSFHHCSIQTFNLEHYSYQDKVACVGIFQQRAIYSIEKWSVTYSWLRERCAFGNTVV